jgi:hypothetical protein
VLALELMVFAETLREGLRSGTLGRHTRIEQFLEVQVRRHRLTPASIAGVVRVVDLHVMDVNELVQTVFSGLSPPVMEDVTDEGERIVVRARTPLDTAVCPVCGASSDGCTAITGGRCVGVDSELREYVAYKSVTWWGSSATAVSIMSARKQEATR